MKKKNLNDYIKKSHIAALEKFKAELEAWRKETQEEVATLYEDAFTSFTLADISVKQGCLFYTYDGEREYDGCVRQDEETGEFYEVEYDGIMNTVKFWRSCLHRAQRYWHMDTEELDAIQNGEKEDNEEEED